MPKLRPRARIVRTIGDQLISGPEAALIELVKNAYDADSPYALIHIIPAGDKSEPKGCISVSDEGHGMAPEDVIDKWLEPATDEKLTRRTSPRGRQMLGAKGIGRFAASRLGKLTALESVHRRADGSLVSTRATVDWSWFESARYLDEVDIPLDSANLPAGSARSTGVTLMVRELRDIWTKKRLESLIKELRRVASPYDKAMTSFKIRLDLRAFTESGHGFNGQELLTGMNLGTAKDSTSEPDALLIRPFGLQEHADYVLEGTFDAEGGFTGGFTIERGDGKLHKLALSAPAYLEEESSCGSFSIRINIYDRERESIEALFKRMGLDFSKIGMVTARRTLTENAGIAIFRKGFRIRPYGDAENDWLELEHKRVQDPSRKLGMSQVSGVVEIEDERKSGLVERSSREGLEHTPEFQRLKRMLTDVLMHAEERRFEFREKAGISRAPRGSLGKVRDTAALKRVAQAAKSLPKEFQETVEKAINKDSAELAAELNQIDEYQQVLESRAALGLVVAEVLHEGRRLLNPVSTSAKALLESTDWFLEDSKRGKLFREQFPEYASVISTGASGLARLFKRLDPISGRRRGRPKYFAVAVVVQQCVDLFKEQIARNAIRIDVAGNEKIEAYGYEEDLQAALMNIVDNAIHWLSTSTGHRDLGIETRKSGNTVTISVSNNGPAIDDAYLPRLFDAGFTLKSGGTGLGLAIAREALRRSKGELLFDDAALDTTFKIRLPAEQST